MTQGSNPSRGIQEISYPRRLEFRSGVGPTELNQSSNEVKRRDATTERLAAKYVWWKEPAAALADQPHFLGMIMTYGTLEDVQWMVANFSEDELREAIEQAQPGVFNGRSWSYWHLRLGITERRELPKRRLPP